MCIEDRSIGWLDELLHARLREILAHALGRNAIACPLYCIMPDHAHFLWQGMSDRTDQRVAARMLRTHWATLLKDKRCTLQRQPYDHVLRENERDRGAVQSVAHYILENPVRKGIAAEWRAYPFSGCVVPGFFNLDPRMDDFWDRYWRIQAAWSAGRV